MSADQAGQGFSLKNWCHQFQAKSLRQILSGAVALSVLASGSLVAQQSVEFPTGSRGQIHPVQMQRLQLDGPLAPNSAVSGQVDAIHSPNVDRLLKPQYNLDLEKRHSQLVMTNMNIRCIDFSGIHLG